MRTIVNSSTRHAPIPEVTEGVGPSSVAGRLDDDVAERAAARLARPERHVATPTQPADYYRPRGRNDRIGDVAGDRNLIAVAASILDYRLRGRLNISLLCEIQ